MKATLLIVTRNRATQLKLALASIRRMAYRDVDILVVDDASTDETQSVLCGYDHLLSSYRLERTGGYRKNPAAVLNIGHGLARSNIVIEQGGEVCHLTDCVTPLAEACMPGLVVLARVHNGTSEQMELIAEDIAMNRYEFPANFEPEHVRTSGRTWKVPRIGPQGVPLYCGVERPAPFLFLGAIHRQDFEAIGGYDETRTNGNDEDLANRLLARGVRFRFIGNAVAFHLSHGKS